MLAVERTDAKQVASQETEDDDYCCYGDGAEYAQHEIGAIVVEPLAHEGHDWKKDVVEEVDVEGACADVLERTS